MISQRYYAAISLMALTCLHSLAERAYSDEIITIPEIKASAFKSGPAREAVREYNKDLSTARDDLKSALTSAKKGLDNKLQEAMAEAIGKKDNREVQRIVTFLNEDIAAGPKGQPKKQGRIHRVVGRWSGSFFNSRKDVPISIVVHDDLSVDLIGRDNTVDRSRITPYQQRLLVLTKDPMHFWEHFELVPNGDRLIALGWNRKAKTGGDPYKDPPTVVAILNRVPGTSGSNATGQAAGDDPFNKYTVWASKGNNPVLTLTITQRNGTRFEGELRTRRATRRFTGFCNGQVISWKRKDVTVSNGGNPGGDNSGVIQKQNGSYRIDMKWINPDGSKGSFSLFPVGGG